VFRKLKPIQAKAKLFTTVHCETATTKHEHELKQNCQKEAAAAKANLGTIFVDGPQNTADNWKLTCPTPAIVFPFGFTVNLLKKDSNQMYTYISSIPFQKQFFSKLLPYKVTCCFICFFKYTKRITINFRKSLRPFILFLPLSN